MFRVTPDALFGQISAQLAGKHSFGEKYGK
jgi:hypothetical protein